MQATADEDIFDRAAEEGRTIVSADTDFGTLLAPRDSTRPSGVIFRRLSGRRPKIRQDSSSNSCRDSENPSNAAASP